MPKSVRRTLSVIALAASVAAGCTTTAPPQHPLAGFHAAINRGDADAATSVLADDVVVVAGPTCTLQSPCRGRSAARAGFVQPAIAQGYQIQAVGPAVPQGEAQSQRVEIRWTSMEKIMNLGTQRLVGTDMFRFKEGLLVEIRFAPDMEDSQTGGFYRGLAAARR